MNKNDDDDIMICYSNVNSEASRPRIAAEARRMKKSGNRTFIFIDLVSLRDLWIGSYYSRPRRAAPRHATLRHSPFPLKNIGRMDMMKRSGSKATTSSVVPNPFRSATPKWSHKFSATRDPRS